jgi:hypothetical protein
MSAEDKNITILDFADASLKERDKFMKDTFNNRGDYHHIINNFKTDRREFSSTDEIALLMSESSKRKLLMGECFINKSTLDGVQLNETHTVIDNEKIIDFALKELALISNATHTNQLKIIKESIILAMNECGYHFYLDHILDNMKQIINSHSNNSKKEEYIYNLLFDYTSYGKYYYLLKLKFNNYTFNNENKLVPEKDPIEKRSDNYIDYMDGSFIKQTIKDSVIRIQRLYNILSSKNPSESINYINKIYANDTI